MRKDKRLLILVLALLFMALLSGTAYAYSDVPDGAWYAEAVDYVSGRGLMTGVSDTAFAPDSPVTRGMIVTILYREAGSPAFVGKAEFSDVAEGAWYAAAVEWAAEVGLVIGYGNGLFGPEDPVTREQMAVMLRQYAKMRVVDVTKTADISSYTDAASVSGWANEALRWAVAEDLISGTTADTLDPGGKVIRAQAAAMLMRFLSGGFSVTAPALVKSVTLYGVDYETKEWVKWEKKEYTYENGYPATLTTSYPGADEVSVETFAYSFENGLPLIMSASANGEADYTVEYNSGERSKVSENVGIPGSTRHLVYIYGNDDGYFTAVLHSSHVGDPSDPAAPCYNAEEYDEVQVTVRNGLLLQTVNRGLYSNWMDGEDREWMYFNGTYTVNYDSDGIISHTSSQFRDGQPSTDYLFEVKKAEGRVTEVIRKTQTADSGEITNEAKIVFEYYDSAMDSGRYSRMINAHIMEEGNSFYIYNWY